MATLSIIAEVAEQIILDAMQRGEFDNLSGKGRPLPPADDALVPEDLRMAFKILKNSGHLPPDIQERKDITTALELLQNCQDEQERYRQIQKVNYLTMKLNARRRKPVNLELDQVYYDKIVERTSVKGKR
ncbi:MAG: DnaJ family domain-containing protein [Thermodesulfobacteriota bacterium]